jgi:hypothetical protein
MGGGLGVGLAMMGDPVLDILISEMYTKDKGKKTHSTPPSASTLFPQPSRNT